MIVGSQCLLELICALFPLQLILEFEGGLKLAFCDARRFGKIRLQEDPANNEPVSKLGFDPVLEMVDIDEFRQMLAAQRRAIKTVILDQVHVSSHAPDMQSNSKALSSHSRNCPCRTCSATEIFLPATQLFTTVEIVAKPLPLRCSPAAELAMTITDAAIDAVLLSGSWQLGGR